MPPRDRPAGGAAPPAALLLRPGPDLAPAARRVARALMETAAREGLGLFREEAGGTLRLEGPPGALEAAHGPVSALLAGRDAVLAWEAPPEAGGPGGPEGALERALATAQADSLLRLRPVVGLSPAGRPRLAGLRLRASARGLAALLPAPEAAGGEAALLAHARVLVARRGVEAVAEAGISAWPGGEATVPLHLDLPPEALPLPAALAGLPVLPLLPARALAAPPPGPFAVQLAEDLLPLLDIAHLPGAALHLRGGAAAEAALPGLGPGRVVWEGLAEEAALRRLLAAGVGRFSGPLALDLLREAGGWA